jgi:hypothetical protein
MACPVRFLTFEEAVREVEGRVVELGGEASRVALAVLRGFKLSAAGPWRLIRGYEVRKEEEGVRAVLYFDGAVSRYNELVVSARGPSTCARLLLRRVSKACVSPLRTFLITMRGLLRHYKFDFYARIEGALRPDVLIDVVRMGFEPVKGSDALELDGRQLSLAFP